MNLKKTYKRLFASIDDKDEQFLPFQLAWWRKRRTESTISLPTPREDEECLTCIDFLKGNCIRKIFVLNYTEITMKITHFRQPHLRLLKCIINLSIKHDALKFLYFHVHFSPIKLCRNCLLSHQLNIVRRK